MFSVVVSIFPSQALLLFSHLLSDGEWGRDPLFGLAAVAVKTVSQLRRVLTFTVLYHILQGIMRDTLVRLGCLLGLTKNP